MRAVVTGAAGFIGSAVSAALSARGWDVDGVDLAEGTLAAGGAIVAGDISRRGGWEATFDGADLVVHTAAIVSESGDRARFVDVNVEGTRNVCDAAVAGGVARVVHVSSIVVYGPSFADGVDEKGPVQPSGSPYTDTKIAAEHAALAVAHERDLALTIVRPGDVYGPRSVPWTIRPIEMLRRRQFVLIDGGRGILTPTYVDDLVAGITAAASSDAAAGRTYNIAGGVGVPAHDFFGFYAQAMGRSLPSVPSPVARGLASAAVAVAGLAGRDAPFAPEALEYVSHPGTYSIERARSELGWEPAVDLVDGMERTIAWARSQGLLPS